MATTTQNSTLVTVGTATFNNAHKQIRSMPLDSQKPSGFGPRDPEPEKALHQGSEGADGGGGGIRGCHSLTLWYVTFCGPCTSCCMYSDVQNAWSQGYPARVIQDGKTTINQRAVGVVREGGRGWRRGEAFNTACWLFGVRCVRL